MKCRGIGIHPSWREQLKYAIKHPESDETKLLDRKCAKYMIEPSSKISWSAGARRNVKRDMYAKMQTYGPANWFITVSPGMMYNWLAQKIMKRHTGDVTEEGRCCGDFDPGDLDTRSIRAAANPVDCARVFDEMVESNSELACASHMVKFRA